MQSFIGDNAKGAYILSKRYLSVLCFSSFFDQVKRLLGGVCIFLPCLLSTFLL